MLHSRSANTSYEGPQRPAGRPRRKRPLSPSQPPAGGATVGGQGHPRDHAERALAAALQRPRRVAGGGRLTIDRAIGGNDLRSSRLAAARPYCLENEPKPPPRTKPATPTVAQPPPWTKRPAFCGHRVIGFRPHGPRPDGDGMDRRVGPRRRARGVVDGEAFIARSIPAGIRGVGAALVAVPPPLTTRRRLCRRRSSPPRRRRGGSAPPPHRR